MGNVLVDDQRRTEIALLIKLLLNFIEREEKWTYQQSWWADRKQRSNSWKRTWWNNWTQILSMIRLTRERKRLNDREKRKKIVFLLVYVGEWDNLQQRSFISSDVGEELFVLSVFLVGDENILISDRMFPFILFYVDQEQITSWINSLIEFRWRKRKRFS